LDVKLLLKRGALLAAANWPLIAIQFAAETTFQVLLAVPLIGAAILVAALLGGDLANLLQGTLREMFTTITGALMAEPVALVSFIAAFALVLVGGSMLVFLVKGGVMDVLLEANHATGAIEREALTLDAVRSASRFSLERFVGGCARLFRPYVVLGFWLMLVYLLTGASYFAFIVYGYRAAGDGFLFLGWAFLAAIATLALVVWISLVNLVYLLLQLVVAADGVTIADGLRVIARFARARFRPLGIVFLIVLTMVVGATFVSALAWSGVGLIAFVPLVGLAVFPLQMAALLLRGLLFEYIGLTAIGAYLTLYRQPPDDRATA
jgi:hypothetical protein